MITQPKGISAFGYGILGFFGGNIIINAACAVLMIPIITMAESNAIYGLFAFPAFGVSVWLAMLFSNKRAYDATSIGVQIAVVFQCVSFVIGLVSGF